MGATRFGSSPGEREATWANETLPLTVRRELLARELRKLGFERAGADAGAPVDATPQQQQPQQQQQQQQPQPQREEQGPRGADATPHAE